MLRTLRGQLFVSHVVPLLIIVPLMGVALIYVVETRLLLPKLEQALAGQGRLLADMAGANPALWRDPALSRDFAARAAARVNARVMLLDAGGRLLASSESADETRVGDSINIAAVREALKGHVTVRAGRSRSLDAEVADALVPVLDHDRVAGIVRLSTKVVNVRDEFTRLRLLIGAVLLVGVLLGGAVGVTLALNLERRLTRVTRAVQDLAMGQPWVLPSTDGPEEVDLLAHSFNALVERLRTFEQARRQLLANLVHELGRPLGAVQAALQAFQGGAYGDPALRQELLAGMADELRRLRRLLDDLASLHDQVLGTLELHRQPIVLDAWLRRTLAPWRQAAEGRGLRWEDDVPADLPPAEVDPDRLGQALGNLLSNAVKYTPAGGKISVQVGARDDRVWIRVSDTGPGIVADDLVRVFEPLFRGQSPRRFPQGMGLGLTIARDLVSAHGGTLEADSTPGVGSHFTIRIPARLPETPA